MTTIRIARPQADEYGEFYTGYINRVPDGADIFDVLRQQPDNLRTLLQNVDDRAASVRPAPAEWSIKEVLGHVCDAERIFAYRTLRFARGDTTPLPGFNQNQFVEAANFNARSLSDLLDEFAAQRQANVLCFHPLTDEEINRRGTASNNSMSVRAMLYVMAGHVLHHIESLTTDYQVGL
jgi:uncharacterized damage-inducible protein DinB